MKRILKAYLLLLLASSVLFFSACAKDLVTGEKVYNVYSLDSDVKLGRYVMKSQLKALRKADKKVDPKKYKKELKRVRKIVHNIVQVSHYPKFPYEVHIADVDVVNAWCAPGGKIMVYSGLWDHEEGLVEKKSDDQMAAVLAHEIAHATARHVTESISRNMTILSIGTLATQAVSAASGVGGDIFYNVFSHGMNVFIPSYSRKNELESDRLGLIYMAKAGYDPRAAVRLWQKAAKKKGNRTSIYSTHPSSGSRARELIKHLPEAMKYYMQAKEKVE